MCEHTLTNICDSRKPAENQKVYKGEQDQKTSINLVILVRIPPNFLYKSRVLHLVCTPTGVYSRKGVVLTFCFSKNKIFMSTIMNGDGNYACVLLRNFIFILIFK